MTRDPEGWRSGDQCDPEEGRRVGDGERQRDGGGAKVRRKENKDRTQSNQQQLKESARLKRVPGQGSNLIIFFGFCVL